MLWQVLATDVDHSGPSLMLFNDKEGRILFNAGEGLQRLFRESKTKMQKVRVCGQHAGCSDAALAWSAQVRVLNRTKHGKAHKEVGAP